MSWYVKELKKLVKSMTDESFKELSGIYKSLGYKIEFDAFSQNSAPLEGLCREKPALEAGFSRGDARRAEGGIIPAIDESISSQVRIAKQCALN